jgi:hypothetical protein
MLVSSCSVVIIEKYVFCLLTFFRILTVGLTPSGCERKNVFYKNNVKHQKTALNYTKKSKKRNKTQAKKAKNDNKKK